MRTATIPLLLLLLHSWQPYAAEPPRPDPQQAARDKLIVQSLLRLKDVSVDGNDKLQATVVRHASRVRGSEVYFQLADRFRIAALDDDLFALALAKPSETAGVRAGQLLVDAGQVSRFVTALTSKDQQQAAQAATLAGHMNLDDLIPHLQETLNDRDKSRVLRTSATYALGRTIRGQHALLNELKKTGLPKDLHVAAANVLYGSSDEAIRKQVDGLLVLPQGAGTKPLPPLAELLAMRGNPVNGKLVFEGKATCSKCHRVRGNGKEVGPDLSEIGSKLSREAFFVSILDPSAGISHSYENYNVSLTSGNVLAGIIVSRTDESITLKTSDAIVRTLQVDDIEEMVKTNISMMPSDLQRTMTAQELTDVVHYLETLKKE